MNYYRDSSYGLIGYKISTISQHKIIVNWGFVRQNYLQLSQTSEIQVEIQTISSCLNSKDYTKEKQ